MTVEDLLGPVTVTDVAHGGHCVARLDGRVLFVRHALPGEVVRVQVTDARHDRFWRADAIEIVEAAPHRRTPPCPVFRPGACGGCDFQHAGEPIQRELKTRVIADQLVRLGGYDWSGHVEEVAPVFGWRTRMRYQLSAAGPGLRAHRSHRVVTLPKEGCRLATVDVREVLPQPPTPGASELLVVASADGVRTGLPDDTTTVTERVGVRTFQVALNGFWQVHPRAADVLVAAVVEGLDPHPGERAFDLYCGVGLFTGALADRGVQVEGVESGRTAAAHARTNVPQATITVGRVERALGRLPRRTDLVVLDPPRAGAGRAVLEQIAQRRPRAVAYVSCDPAALARDVRHAASLGWRVASIRAFDLFPQTHHVECVAILIP
jgi:tRNA/tmRNA/rRNA uracil-C5-methylase (TrmA/RlmC/RlmD family)